MLSPLEGEGISVMQQTMMGEGVSSKEALLVKRTPHPLADAAIPSGPLPAGCGLARFRQL
jgi:hypothetical protein